MNNKISFETYSEALDAWDIFQKRKIERVLSLEHCEKYSEKKSEEKAELVFKKIVEEDRVVIGFLTQSFGNKNDEN